MNEEEKLSIANRARTAALSLNWLTPIFIEMEDESVGALKNAIRSKQYTELELVSHISQLISIDNIKDKLQGMVLAGEAMEKNLNGTSRPND